VSDQPAADDGEALPIAISVVMPAYNEATIIEQSLATVLGGMRGSGERFEVVVVENGSTDDTEERAGKVAADEPEVRVIHLATADYGEALRAGLLSALGEVVVNFDCDYYDVAFVQQALARLRDADSPATIVVGSKRAPGAEDRRSWTRRMVTATFSTMLRVGFGLTVSDTHGMKALRRAPLLPVVARCRFGRDLFDTELILRAERAGLAVAEIPVDVEELRPARTPVARRIPRTLFGLARLWFVLRTSRRE
jgi:glycosyltransferase involved in cell wall biosynthesis